MNDFVNTIGNAEVKEATVKVQVGDKVIDAKVQDADKADAETSTPIA